MLWLAVKSWLHLKFYSSLRRLRGRILKNFARYLVLACASILWSDFERPALVIVLQVLLLQVLLRVLNSDLFLEFDRWDTLVRVLNLAIAGTANSTNTPTTAVLVPLRPYRY